MVKESLPSWNSAATATERVATKSIMSPMLWLVGVAGLTCAPLTVFSVSPLNYIFGALLIGLIIYTAAFFGFFAFKDPDRLQSEEYRLENRRIDVGTFGDDRNLGNVIEGEKVVSNPHLEPVKEEK